jgi:hypothetical protein
MTDTSPITTEPPATDAHTRAIDHPTQGRGAAAKVFIAHGLFWFVAAISVWTAWIISGDAKPNTTGRGLEPHWYVGLVRGVEIAGLIVTLWMLWHFVVKPKRRTGRLSFDGLFFLGCWMMYFQEPWINWSSLQFLYSTTFVNFGCWCNHVPGWTSPNGNLIPVAALWGTAYLWIVALPAYAASKLMSWTKRRNPSISNLRLVIYCFIGFCIFDFVQDVLFLHTQLFNFGATIHSLTLFNGTDYAFPIYEAPMWGGTLTMLACLHFFRDDRGRSIPERGIDQLGIRNGKVKTLARYLAIMGVCQLAILLPYNIPYNYIGQRAGSIAAPLVERPWRIGGVCGPATAYDCPNTKLPLATVTSPTNRIDK